MDAAGIRLRRRNLCRMVASRSTVDVDANRWSKPDGRGPCGLGGCAISIGRFLLGSAGSPRAGYAWDLLAHPESDLHFLDAASLLSRVVFRASGSLGVSAGPDTPSGRACASGSGSPRSEVRRGVPRVSP